MRAQAIAGSLGGGRAVKPQEYGGWVAPCLGASLELAKASSFDPMSTAAAGSATATVLSFFNMVRRGIRDSSCYLLAIMSVLPVFFVGLCHFVRLRRINDIMLQALNSRLKELRKSAMQIVAAYRPGREDCKGASRTLGNCHPGHDHFHGQDAHDTFRGMGMNAHGRDAPAPAGETPTLPPCMAKLAMTLRTCWRGPLFLILRLPQGSIFQQGIHQSRWP
jgi:hypothetical protein